MAPSGYDGLSGRRTDLRVDVDGSGMPQGNRCVRDMVDTEFFMEWIV